MTLEALRAVFEAQRGAAERTPRDHATRMQALAALGDGVRRREDELVRAISDDFGGRPREETLVLELFPLYDQIRHARRHLKEWMRRRRVPSVWYLRPSRAFYQYQPLGVVGVIGAWNYQLLLALGPVVDALAAGNRVMVKPSEITPRSAEVIASIIDETFPREEVACVTGGPDVASAFASLPFDHLVFTGSARVGRLVLEAAAANLTPVTLELGGKSPAIVHREYPLAMAVDRIMTAKLFNAGQTCVAPDYALVASGHEDAFVREARRVVHRRYPEGMHGPDYTRIVSDHHYRRLRELLDDAACRGAKVVQLAGDVADLRPGDRVVPPALVLDVRDDMRLMQEEIFGPILPVVTYRTLDEAIDYVDVRPRPLALYYFDHDRRRVDNLLDRTMSGGVTVNDCMLHFGQLHLPFGGVGPSGMGHYHGFDGFKTFSKKRPVMVQRRWSVTSLFRPPYTPRTRRLIDLALRAVTRRSR